MAVRRDRSLLLDVICAATWKNGRAYWHWLLPGTCRVLASVCLQKQARSLCTQEKGPSAQQSITSSEASGESGSTPVADFLRALERNRRADASQF